MKKSKIILLSGVISILSICGCGVVSEEVDGQTPPSEQVNTSPSEQVNTPPVANAQNLSFVEDSVDNVITLSGSDADGDTLSYRVTVQPSHGTLSGTAPNLKYTPNADYYGSDSLSFKVNDGKVDSTEVVVTINISDVGEITSLLKKTGQTTSYTPFDDGYYQIGVTPSYTRDDTKEIVRDNLTGLMWKDNNDAKTLRISWQGAMDYCDTSTLHGYSDWRLPAVEELESLIVYDGSQPSIDSTFRNAMANPYWSSTSVSDDTTKVWLVSFSFPEVYANPKSTEKYFRCVR